MSKSLFKHRYLWLRRISQLSILLLFLGTVRWGWTLGGKRILTGNLSASKLLDIIPMSDPFATLQILVSGQTLLIDTLIGAVIVLIFYTLLGSRMFCSWVCPINMVTDAADWLRRYWMIRTDIYISRNVRYGLLIIMLVLSAINGLAAFEWWSPIGIFHRELIYGFGLGWTVILAIFVMDFLVLKHGWCGHLCPLGAFYSLVGKQKLLKIRFEKDPCTSCGECHKVCPEPQVLNLKLLFEGEWVDSVNCTNCGRCITECPENCFSFGNRFSKSLKVLSNESDMNKL